MLLEKIDELLKEVSTLTAQNAEEVEQLRIKYLSKKGEINALMADFRTVPADQKKEVGVKINELKNAALEKINGLKEQMEEAEASSQKCLMQLKNQNLFLLILRELKLFLPTRKTVWNLKQFALQSLKLPLLIIRV